MSHNHDHQNLANIKLAFLLNFTFALLEVIGGLWTNSMAILSDALHDLGDSVSLGLAWFLEDYSHQAPDEKFSFGYSRFSLLGALINGIILIVGSLFILTEAVPRLLHPESIKPTGMMFFALAGIVVNGLAAFKLQGGESLNKKVVSWHLIEDLLGWVAVLVVSIILIFKELPILDPLLSIAITGYILYNIIQHLQQVLTVFLQGVPQDISISEIEEEIAKLSNVKRVDHTHSWSLEGETNLLSTHVVVEEQITKDEIINLKE
ncbi:MAG: cation diffusion facilitator family transporter [Bacillota bacterium]